MTVAQGFSSTTDIGTIYPSFVMHKVWDTPEGFNESLYDIAKVDAIENRIQDPNDSKNIGTHEIHLGHIRHNFLADYSDKEPIKILTEMVDTACREYLLQVYHYEHTGKLNMMSDTFWQRRSHHENVGINAHTHIKCDLVVTYYPKIHLDENATGALHKGAFRAYDPSNYGKRFWPTNNPTYYIGGWYQVEPVEGSMIILEGYVPHDSTYFSGDERMCIPILVDVDTPKKHMKVDSDVIIRS